MTASCFPSRVPHIASCFRAFGTYSVTIFAPNLPKERVEFLSLESFSSFLSCFHQKIAVSDQKAEKTAFVKCNVKQNSDFDTNIILFFLLLEQLKL